MNNTQKALLWAATILGMAAYSNHIGMSDAASWGLTMGLVGAAWASIEGSRRRSCGAASNRACG